MDTTVLASSHQVMASKARTFHWAANLLPAAVRDDAAVVYAICRLADDTADEARDPVSASAALDELRDELRGDRPPRPLVAEFLAAARRLDLPVDSALELVEGVRSDLGTVELQDEQELVRYCYRVASTVGLMMCAVLRVRSTDALPHAVDLGVAMQMTNIARDVAEDAALGRVYLPAAWLRAEGVTPDQLRRGAAEPAAVAGVVAHLLDLADIYYSSADRGMRAIPARYRFAILVASRVYRAIGVRLRRRACDALSGRVIVPPRERAIWAARALAAGVTPSMLGLGQPHPHDPLLHRALAGLPGADARAG